MTSPTHFRIQIGYTILTNEIKVLKIVKNSRTQLEKLPVISYRNLTSFMT